MKNIYLSLLGLLFTGLPCLLHAQLSADPNPAFNSSFSFDEFDVVANSFVTNNYGSHVEVTWLRNVVSIPDDWDSAVCDKIACHFFTASESTFNMAPGETSNIDVHVYNWDATPGTALIEVHLVADVSPEDTLTVAFIFDNALNTVQRLRQNIQLYPNPTNDVVWFKSEISVERAEVYDLGGKLLREVSLFGNEMLNLTGLPAGQYIVRTYGSGNVPLSANVVTRL